MSTIRRRSLIVAGLAGLTAPALVGCAARVGTPEKARVLVVGGGFGGATAAHYLRLWSDHALDVVLVEPDAGFVSCPLSNLVLGGSRTLAELSVSYDALQRRHGVTVVRDRVTAIDTAGRVATLAGGARIRYDKLVLSPGIDLQFDAIGGLAEAHAAGRVLQAWKAGPETWALRRQLEAMPDGGVYAITIPEAPYRCPPGPYERACQVASYFKAAKPKSKVLVLDANPDVTSKPALFKKVWAESYGGMVEYRPLQKAVSVDADGRTVRFELSDPVRADVLNLLPPMRAAGIARDAGVVNGNGRWCVVDFVNFESTAAKHVHVLGDAILAASLMPKSAHMANSHAKVAAAAIVAEFAGIERDPAPMLTNTCYSFVDASRVIHVASVHAYDAAQKTYTVVPGSGGVSSGPTELEGRYAWNWARTMWADALS